LLSGATWSRFRRAAGASGLRGRGTPIARFLETTGARNCADAHHLWSGTPRFRQAAKAD